MWPKIKVMAKQTAKRSALTRNRPRAKAARTARTARARLSEMVDKGLLARARRFAGQRGVTLADLVAEGLEKVIGPARAPVLPPGDIAPAAPEGGPWGQLLTWMDEQQAALTDIRNALGDVAASLPADSAPGASRAASGSKIPPS